MVILSTKLNGLINLRLKCMHLYAYLEHRIFCQVPDSTYPVDANPWRIVVTFIKESPDEPITAELALLGCFKECKSSM